MLRLLKYEQNYALRVGFMDQTDKRILQVLQTDGKLHLLCN
jgi:Lrp/AsnC family transcriptional regulator, leucine-responsive regulatory protein